MLYGTTPACAGLAAVAWRGARLHVNDVHQHARRLESQSRLLSSLCRRSLSEPSSSTSGAVATSTSGSSSKSIAWRGRDVLRPQLHEIKHKQWHARSYSSFAGSSQRGVKYAIASTSTSTLWNRTSSIRQLSSASNGLQIHSHAPYRSDGPSKLAESVFMPGLRGHRPSGSRSASQAGAPSRFDNSNNGNDRNTRKPRRRWWFLQIAAALALAGVIGWYFMPPVRRFMIAIKRCSLVGVAVLHCIWDYKVLFRKEWDDPAVRHNDYKKCHKQCAERVLEVLQANGGIYIKIGQHLSAVQLIPEEWSKTMRPLQDQCSPTPIDEIQRLFLSDVGEPLDNLFSDFNPNPIGVASLAQVHIAIDKLSGRKVAVKIMHPDLQEFTQLDMTTTSLMLKVVRFFFPSFEFTWLGEEMEQNLPLEMDFRHEASNAKHCIANFSKLRKTSLVVPEVLWSQERILVMEFIEGGRVDDLEYLSRHGIDRNAVSCEISRIFSQMLFVDGSFHGDPHAGNLLIRPVSLAGRSASRSKHNFEIVLLDHGLWFDISESLRTNYARLWLAFLKPKTPEVDAERRRYAELVGNIQPEMYPIFEAAITGRAGMEEQDFDAQGSLQGTLDGSVIALAVQTPEEQQRVRNAFAQEGMIESIFELLRRVPRRLLMVLKINDLTRSLDKSLNPSHPPWRVWLIVARFCCMSVYRADLAFLNSAQCTLKGLSLWRAKMSNWMSFELWYRGLGIVEWLADRYARWNKAKAWTVGLLRGGWREARAREAGLL